MLPKKLTKGAGRPLIAVAPLAATASSPEEKGLAIAEEADRRDLGFGDHTSSSAWS